MADAKAAQGPLSMTNSSGVAPETSWKDRRDLARRLEAEASAAAVVTQRSKYYRLAGESYLRAARLAPYDRQDLMAGCAARCYDAVASLMNEVA